MRNLDEIQSLTLFQNKITISHSQNWCIYVSGSFHKIHKDYPSLFQIRKVVLLSQHISDLAGQEKILVMFHRILNNNFLDYFAS